MSLDTDRLKITINLVEEAISKGYFPGAQVVVGSSNKTYLSKSFGNRCLYPEVLPMKDDTLFDLASLTKVVAVSPLFTLFLEKGLISVYDKVSDYIEDFKGEKKEDIRIINLLTHTAGFIPFTALYETCSDYEDAISYISKKNLEYEPGTKVVYSDYSFILLGYILEQIGQERLDKLCEKYIFEPLSMKNTCFNPKGDNIAATEIDKKTGKPLVGVCHDENGRFFDGISGHAGLFSNKEDMEKYARMLVRGGEGFFSKLAFKAMTTNHAGHLNEGRGYGWCINDGRLTSSGDIASIGAFGHTGFTGTSIWIDRQNDVFMILLTNRVHPTRENNEVIRFRRLFHNSVLAAVK